MKPFVVKGWYLCCIAYCFLRVAGSISATKGWATYPYLVGSFNVLYFSKLTARMNPPGKKIIISCLVPRAQQCIQHEV